LQNTRRAHAACTAGAQTKHKAANDREPGNRNRSEATKPKHTTQFKRSNMTLSPQVNAISYGVINNGV